MMPVDGLLTFEDGQVSLGSDLLPGVLVSMAIRGAVRFDEAEQDGVSGNAKVPMGWEDADIILVVDLLTDVQRDCYAKLARLSRVFKAADKGANPKIYAVANRHTQARGIDQVVFNALESSETDQEDTIRVTLAFTEHIPAVVQHETRVNASDAATGGGSAPAVSAPEPTLAVNLVGED